MVITIVNTFPFSDETGRASSLFKVTQLGLDSGVLVLQFSF